jgi:hypothetical protein
VSLFLNLDGTLRDEPPKLIISSKKNYHSRNKTTLGPRIKVPEFTNLTLKENIPPLQEYMRSKGSIRGIASTNNLVISN